MRGFLAFWMGGASGGVAAPIVIGPSSSEGGIPSRRRRRYIMPDRTMLEATTQEAFEWLQRYSAPMPLAVPAPRSQAIRMPAIVLEKRDVRFIPATDALPDTWKAVISERFAYQPLPQRPTRQAQNSLNRMRADEEAIVALMLWH